MDSCLQEQVLVLLINLDRSEDRLQRMSRRLDDIGLSWQRLSAVDGRGLDLDGMPEISVQDFERLHGKALKPAEAGCYLSHLAAIDAFLASDRPFALIAEDDVVFADDLCEVLAALLENADHWDMVKLSGMHSGLPLPVLPLIGDYRLSVPLAQHTGSGLYLVNRHAARRLSEGLLPMRLPYDHAFDRAWALNFRMRLVKPMPGNQMTADSAHSTIGYGDNPTRKFPWYRRITMASYRLGNELQRFIYNLFEWQRARRAFSGRT